MGQEINIEMNRFNGVDYDVILPRCAVDPNALFADTPGVIAEENPIAADFLKVPRKIGNADFDGKNDITTQQMGVQKLATESEVTFLASGWVLNETTDCYEQSVACDGLLATDSVKDVDIYPIGNDDAEIQQATDTASSMVNRMCCNVDGVLYARCSSDAPEVDFSVKVVQHR